MRYATNSRPLGTLYQARGVSLIELMLSMAIGLVLLVGVMAVFFNSRTAYHSSEAQVHLLDDGRYALHLLGQDLRMAGSIGQNSWLSGVQGRALDSSPNGGPLVPLAGDCEPLWYINMDRKVEASNDVNPYGGSCIPASYRLGSDVLVVRYANATAVADANLQAGMTYAQSTLGRSQLFTFGTDPTPTFAPDQNHRLEVHAYYVANFTDAVGDGMPSLHRISLAPGPRLMDQVVVPGVEDFQVQFGISTCQAPPCSDLDQSVNQYVNANAINWADPLAINNVFGVKVWVLLRTQTEEKGINTDATFNLGGQVRAFVGVDNFRRLLLSSIVQIRNRGN